MTADYVDVQAVLNGTLTPPQPSVGGCRSDGMRLLYRATVGALLGAPEAGKTLVAGGMAADELFSGGRVLWIDLDHNGAHALLNRLLMFGIASDMLTDSERFRLAIPGDADEVAAVVADCSWAPTLVILDSIGELLPMYGANSNDADDYTRVHRAVLTALANRGASVLAIDHEAKGHDSRAYGATGSAAKKRAIDGVLLRVTNVRPFSPADGGEAHLSVVKDRHGALRSLGSGREPVVAAFELLPVAGGMKYTFSVPQMSSVATRDDLDLLRGLIPPPTSVRDVKDRMGWGTGRASDALKAFRGTAGNVPGTDEVAGVPLFPSPKGGTENAPGNKNGVAA